jgi:hypothetical protein
MNQRKQPEPKYSPEQLAEFARQFVPKSRRYRLRYRIGLTSTLGGLVGGMLFAPSWPWAFPIGWVLGLLSMVFLVITWRFLPACPACRSDIGRRFGKFCRECGEVLVPDPEQQIHPICPSGGHAFYNSAGKYRRGQVRHCPCCGLFLDEKGL